MRPSHRDLAALGLLALAVHTGWALSMPVPEDLDPAYYRHVARNLAEGRGAVSDAVWQVRVPPERLPAPADLHWMPLPSRVLVPGMWLWPAHGDRAVTVLLAAAWAPLAWALARALQAGRWTALGAGALAVAAPAYARAMDAPDSIALYGVVGGLAWLALARRRWRTVVGLAALAALVRNDGFLLAPCLALGLRGPRALLVAAAGPLATAAWTLRSAALAGPGYLEARLALGRLPHKLALFGQEGDPLGLAERIGFAATEGSVTAVLVWLLVLPLPASFAVWRHRREPWIRGALAYWFVAPLAASFLAPALAAHGSVFRSAAALFPLACAVAARGLADLGRWSHVRRGYPLAFLPLLLGAVVVVFTFLVGPARRMGEVPPLLPEDCRLLTAIPSGEPVFTSDPLFVADLCRRPAVVLVPGVPAPRVRELAARYGVRWALAARPADARTWALREDHIPALLPGWTRRADRLWGR